MRLSCLARNAALARQGKKVAGRRCGTGDRGAAVLRLDQAMRGRVGRTRRTGPQTNWRQPAFAEKGAVTSDRAKTRASARTTVANGSGSGRGVVLT